MDTQSGIPKIPTLTAGERLCLDVLKVGWGMTAYMLLREEHNYKAYLRYLDASMKPAFE